MNNDGQTIFLGQFSLKSRSNLKTNIRFLICMKFHSKSWCILPYLKNLTFDLLFDPYRSSPPDVKLGSTIYVDNCCMPTYLHTQYEVTGSTHSQQQLKKVKYAHFDLDIQVKGQGRNEDISQQPMLVPSKLVQVGFNETDSLLT